MKPQSFEYLPTRELDAALDHLAEAGDEAKVLAGGQSLIPVMNLRLAQPAVLIDINPIAELAGIGAEDDHVRIGALVRHRSLEREGVGDPGLSRLFATVATHIGHLPIRVRGSFGGSLAHADPGAEWCLVALALDAEVELARRDGRRVLPIDAFLDGPFTTALLPDELLVAARVARRAGWHYGFAEHARTHGAFALAGACVALSLAEETVAAARVAIMGSGGRAERVATAESALAGTPISAAPAVAADATRASVSPTGYDEVTPEYLRALIGALVGRAVSGALADAEEGR